MDISTKKIDLSNLDYLYFVILVLSVFSIPFLRLEMSFLGARYSLSLPVILTTIYLYLKFIQIITLNRKPFFQVYLSFFLLSFLVWAMISISWSEYRNWSFLFELAFYVLFSVFLINFCELGKPAVRKINQLLFYVVFLMLIVGFFRYSTGLSPWFEFTNHYETELGTRNSDIFMVVTVLPVAFSLLLVLPQKRLKKIIVFLITCSYITAILLSLSRGQLITSILILAVLSFVYILLMRVNYKTVFSTITLTFLLIAGCWLLFSNYFTDTYELFIQRFYTVNDSERILIARYALDVAKEHPFIGIGLENLKFIMPQMVDAHNAYLNVLTELGIIGLSLFSLVLLYPAYGYIKLFRRIKSSPDNTDKGIYIQGFGLLVALIISSMFNTFYNFIYFWIIYVISCCDLVYLNSTNRMFSR